MATFDYYPSKSDPCIFNKQAGDGEPISFVIICVYYGGIIGTPNAIKEVIAALGKYIRLKPWVKWKILLVDKDGVWIYQPKQLKNLKEYFKKILGDTKGFYTTLSAPKTLIIRPKRR
jgi:hypothetical protein